MFNTMKTARKIKEARIAQNMTQMNLADAMEVSYQAVSNWERGNSMPDISKLEQLCGILHITLEELLGSDDATRTLHKIISVDTADSAPITPACDVTHTVNLPSTVNHPEAANSHIAEDIPSMDSADNDLDTLCSTAPITIEELQTVAPLLPPAKIEKLVDEKFCENGNGFRPKDLVPLAPYLDDEYLNLLIKELHVNRLCELNDLVFYLSEDVLETIVFQDNIKVETEDILTIGPYLSEDTLDRLVMEKLHIDKVSDLLPLTNYLSEDTLTTLVTDHLQIDTLYELIPLASYLSEECLDTMIQRAELPGDMDGILALAPYLADDTLDKLATNKLHMNILPKWVSLAPYLNEDTLDKIVLQADPHKHMNHIHELAPYLSHDTLKQLAHHLIQAKNLDALKNLAPYL